MSEGWLERLEGGGGGRSSEDAVGAGVNGVVACLSELGGDFFFRRSSSGLYVHRGHHNDVFGVIVLEGGGGVEGGREVRGDCEL